MLAINKSLPEKYVALRYPLLVFLSAALLIGLTLGSISGMLLFNSDLASSEVLTSTNLQLKDSNVGFWSVFKASIVNDIIIMAAAFIIGLTPYGFIAAILVSLYKGFTIGFSSGLIYSKSGLSGFIGNALVILPGAAAASFAVIFICAAAAHISKNVYGYGRTSFHRRKVFAANAARYILELAISVCIASCAAFINSLCLAIFGGLI